MQADPPARQLPPPGHNPPSHFSKVQQRGGIPSHATNATLRRHRPFNCKYEDLLACRVQSPASPFATRSYHIRHCVIFGELPISVKSGEQGRAPFTTLASFGPGARPSRTGCCPACRALDSREVEQGLLHPLSNKQTLEVEAGPGWHFPRFGAVAAHVRAVRQVANREESQGLTVPSRPSGSSSFASIV